MNHFDRDFNDTDPITHRPFSGGHPDGVSIIVILLSIPLFAATLGASILGHDAVPHQNYDSSLSVASRVASNRCSQHMFLSHLFPLIPQSARYDLDFVPFTLLGLAFSSALWRPRISRGL
jgi:hypothetical protein